MTKIAFVERRKTWYLISLAVLVVGLVSLLLQGLNYGIDFTGGNMLEIEFARETDINDLRGTLDGEGLQYHIQESGPRQFLLRTEELGEGETSALLSVLSGEFGELELRRSDHISAAVGGELTRSALMALAIAAVLIVVYITIRFEFLTGVAALAALIHDVLVTLGIFSLLRLEVNSAFVAALLLIVGYSINDSIVIFDRIRENLRTAGRASDTEIVDLSINQSLFRSLATTTALLLVLFSLLFLGGATIRDFVVAMLIGAVSGAYSSIFIASPLWVDARKRLGGRAPGGRRKARR